MATDLTQARIRVNEHGARLVQRLLRAEILTERDILRTLSPDDITRPLRSRNINRARRVLAEVDRTIAEAWPE